MNDTLHAELLERIGTAETVEELRVLRDMMQGILAALLPTSSAISVCERLNAAHDALIARTIKLAEEAAVRRGLGSPPVPYAYLLFGSGGRMEQTFASDQDSGMLYADPSDEESRSACEAYFEALAEAIVGDLIALGYPPCEGGVISTNVRWRGSLSEWTAMLDGWFEEAEWEMVRHLLIVSDGRMVYGDGTLFEALSDHFHTDMLSKPVIVRRMLDNTMRHKVLIGLFGQLLKERYGADTGGLDIKYGAYIPMVNAIRMMAVQEGLRETSTLERIDRLRDAGSLDEHEWEAYREAFGFVLELRLLTSDHGEDGMHESSGKLPASMLTKEMTVRIKRALRTGRIMQRRISGQTLSKLRQAVDGE